MVWITGSNCQQQHSSLLLTAYDEMNRFETNDTKQQLDVIEVQTAIATELEKRGFEYNEEDQEWSLSVIER